MVTSQIAALVLCLLAGSGEETVAPLSADVLLPFLQQLESTEKGVPERTAAELQKMGRLATPAVAELYSRFAPETRKLLVRHMERFYTPNILSNLKDSLAREEEYLIRRTLVGTIGRIGGLDAARALQAHLQNEGHKAVQRDCLMALGETSDPRAIDMILEYIEKKQDAYLTKIGLGSLTQLAKRQAAKDLPGWRAWWDYHRETIVKAFEEEQKKKSLAKAEKDDIFNF